MDDLIKTINELRDVPSSSWRLKVRRVLVILTSSRSGSSIFAYSLAQHPGIVALDGELEPLLTLTGNGFEVDDQCESDAIERLNNTDALADQIFDGLTINETPMPSQQELHARWRKRLLLQFPDLFRTPKSWEDLHLRLEKILASSPSSPLAVLQQVFRDEPWRLNYYDGAQGEYNGTVFEQRHKLEEPPFVVPSLHRRRCDESDLATKVLMFKSPADAYRDRLYQQLFPLAEIQYLHLTRGYAASVNGLIDGWMSPTGFFSHDLRHVDVKLAIDGYSDQFPYGRHWWKFDLPPNWHKFIAMPLPSVCLNQWLTAHRQILVRGLPTLRVKFEDFIESPARVLMLVCRWLDLPPPASNVLLPLTMVTQLPRPGRWRGRQALLLPMWRNPTVASTMRDLGYSHNTQSWL
jgi:hypothetical protein